MMLMWKQVCIQPLHATTKLMIASFAIFLTASDSENLMNSPNYKSKNILLKDVGMTCVHCHEQKQEQHMYKRMMACNNL